MRVSTELASLLPVLAAFVALTAGCSALGLGGQSLSVNRVSFHGWRDAYRISNGEFQVVVVPEVARIMEYGPVGGDNLLWVNEELTPERNAGATPLPAPKEWQNFGGDKLWPAPEKAWGWPPDWQLDRGPCQVEAGAAPGSLRLVGTASQRHGIRFEREITLAPEGSRLDIVDTAVNVSDKPLTASIWDVTQARADCVGFVPLGRGAAYHRGEGQQPDAQWQQVDDMLLMKPMGGKSGKMFISGTPGWLGCRRGDIIYLKSFSISPTPPPGPETPREFYINDTGYVELEIVGPATELKPGATTSITETWRLLPAGTDAKTDQGLIRTVRRLAKEAGLPPE